MSEEEKPKSIEEILGIPPGSTIIICMPDSHPSLFEDDILGNCAFPECKEPIHWRPHAPSGTHICMKCMVSRIDPKEVDLTGCITKETIQEVGEVLSGRMQKRKQPS